MGGPDIEFPGPTAAEQAGQIESLQLLREQRRQQAESLRLQELLAPYIYKSAGILPRYQGGRIVGFTPVADPMAQRRQQIESQLLDRSLAALSGTLPVDPALERSLSEGESTLRESLLKQIGPGFETSSVGQYALAESRK